MIIRWLKAYHILHDWGEWFYTMREWNTIQCRTCKRCGRRQTKR